MAAENASTVFANINGHRPDREIPSSTSANSRFGFGPGAEMAPIPLSASLHNFSFNHSHSTRHPSDPNLEPTIRALLDQQAEIDAKLAALLPRRYGPNVRVELDMLRHKLRALRALASDNREWQGAEISFIPFFPCRFSIRFLSLWIGILWTLWLYGFVFTFQRVVLMLNGRCLL